ncbi:MAG: zinc ribbon domain-containing protein [Thermoleophilia bacterium]
MQCRPKDLLIHSLVATAAAAALVVMLGLPGAVRAETTTTATGTVPTTANQAAPTETTVAPTATTVAPTETTAPSAEVPAAGVVKKPAEAEELNPGVSFDELDLQVWPEYDQPGVLVLVDIRLPEEATLPFTFRFAIPKGAQLHGVAEVGPDGTFSHGPAPQFDNSRPDKVIVTAEIQKSRSVRLEWYYDPGLNTAGQRDFGVLYEIPADTGEVSLSVQQPARSSGFEVSPPLSPSTSQEGFAFVGEVFGALEAGDQLQYRVSYSKSDGNPSVEPDTGGAPTTDTNRDSILIVLLVLILGVGGFVAYRILRPQPASRRRVGGGGGGGGRRPAPPRRVAAESGGRTGPRNAGARRTGAATARFCTDCGAELKPNGRFCAECGAGRG